MKRNTALLLATACTVVWSAAEALPPLTLQGDKKPSIEVDLHALYVLENEFTPKAQVSAAAAQAKIPFQIKNQADYKDAPQADLVRRHPTLTPVTNTVANAAPPPAPDQRHVTPSTNLPSRSMQIAAQRPLRHGDKPIIMPPSTPPALPYRAERITPQIVTAEKQDDSWVDNSIGYVGGLFGSDEPKDETQMAADSAPPTPVPSAAPTLQKAPSALPDITVAKPTAAPAAPAQNAARYDGYELAEAMVNQPDNQQAFKAPEPITPVSEVPYEMPSTAPAEAPTPAQALPLPKPAPAQGETLLAEAGESSAAQGNVGTLAMPTEILKAAPEPITENNIEQAANTNVNTATNSAQLAPPAEPAPQPTQLSNVQEDQPWYEGLRAELNNFFEDEEKAQEESRVAMAQEQEESLKDVPFLAPPPTADTAVAKVETTPLTAIPSEPESTLPSITAATASPVASALPVLPTGEASPGVRKPIRQQTDQTPVTITKLEPSESAQEQAVAAAEAAAQTQERLEQEAAAKAKAQAELAAARAEQEAAKVAAAKAAEEERMRAQAKAAAEAEAKEEARLAEMKAAAEAEKLAAAKAAEEKRLAEANAAKEAQKKAEAAATAKAKAAEEKRIAEAKAADEAKKLAEAKAAEEAKKLAAAKAEAEAKAKATEEAKLAEAKKIEEARKLAASKAAEEKQLAEVKAAEEAKKQAEALAAQKAAEEQKMAEAKAASEAKLVAAAPTPKTVVIGEKAGQMAETLAPAANTLSSGEVTLKRDSQMAEVVKEKVEADAPIQLASLSQPKSALSNKPTTLGFTGSDTNLASAEKQRLNKIADTLKTSNNQRLAIKAYASADKGQEVLARRIALARGLAVRAYLIEQGVNALRINVQSVGNAEGTDTPDEVVLELKDVGGA